MKQLYLELEQRYKEKAISEGKWCAIILIVSFLICALFIKYPSSPIDLIFYVLIFSLVCAVPLTFTTIFLEHKNDFFLSEDELRSIARKYPDLKSFIVVESDDNYQMRICKLKKEVAKLVELDEKSKRFT